MTLNEQQYKNLNRRYFHGAKTGRISKDDSLFDYFYLSPHFIYAATYACITGREKSKVFEYRLKEGLNIFNAKSKTDIMKLRVGLKKAKIRFMENWYEKGLQNEDWSFLLRNGNKKDKLIQVIKEMNYDGFFNYEWTKKSKTYQKIEIENIENEPAVGIFDIEKLKQVAEYTYKDYFEFDDFIEEFEFEKIELKNYIAALKRTKPDYNLKDFAFYYTKEKCPFLIESDVFDVLENCELKESEKNIYNNTKVFDECIKKGTARFSSFEYKLDEHLILRYT